MTNILEAKKSILYNFTGAMPAAVTPFDSAGNIDASQIGRYAAYLSELNIRGVFLFGTTGEGYSLSLNEKITLLEAWRDAIAALPADRRLVAVVNVSSTVPHEVSALARKVEQLSLDAIAMLPPLYYKATSAEHLVRYLRTIATQAAPTLPLLYYHIPSFSGELKFELESFIECAIAKIPQFVALKFTDSNVIRFGAIHSRFADRINIFNGFEEMLLSTATIGAKAAIGATFSFAKSVAHYQALMVAMRTGVSPDLPKAQMHQSEISALCTSLGKDGNFFAALKAKLNKELADKRITFGFPRAPIWIANDDDHK